MTGFLLQKQRKYNFVYNIRYCCKVSEKSTKVKNDIIILPVKKRLTTNRLTALNFSQSTISMTNLGVEHQRTDLKRREVSFLIESLQKWFYQARAHQILVNLVNLQKFYRRILAWCLEIAHCETTLSSFFKPLIFKFLIVLFLNGFF